MTKQSKNLSPHKAFKFHLVLGIAGILTLPALAGGQRASVGLSSGVAWSARNQAMLLNPSGLSSGDSRLSLYGLYGLDSENITGTFTGMSGATGFGVGAIYDADTSNSYLAGLAFNMKALGIGASLSKVGSEDPTFDVGATLDLNKVRLAAVFKNVGDLTRADFAIGFMKGPLRFEVGVLEDWPLSTKDGTLYTGFVYNAHPLSFSLGAYQPYTNASLTDEAKLRAGLEVVLLKNVAINAEYNSFIDVSEYCVGVRVKY